MISVQVMTVQDFHYQREPRHQTPSSQKTPDSSYISICFFKCPFPLFPDVDVPHPDEKSLITYVSSMYDVMPRVPDVQDGVKANVSRPLPQHRTIGTS